jgi:integrase
MRAGEILALNISDLDFEYRTIRVNKSADDKTRQVRQPKTEYSVAYHPMPSALEESLRLYLKNAWVENPSGWLFPRLGGDRPKSRDKVVRYGLKPILKRLGMETRDVGLHAFRHGLAAELASNSVPIPVLQKQIWHSDPRTTLKIYSHVIPDSQRNWMEAVSIRPIGTKDQLEQENENRVLVM